MRDRSRAFAAFLIPVFAGCFGAAALAAGDGGTASTLVAEAHGVDVEVTVTGVRSGKGVVRACLTSHAQGFPKCREAAGDRALVVPAAERVVFTFPDVLPGRYAIALMHDENRNGKIDRAMLLMPREGFGFSHDAPVRMGPPPFAKAAFEVAGQAVHQPIRMRYML